MPSTAEKFDARIEVMAEMYRVHLVDPHLTQAERQAKLCNLRGRIEGLLIARCEVRGQVATYETVEKKADVVLGVERKPRRIGLIR